MYATTSLNKPGGWNTYDDFRGNIRRPLRVVHKKNVRPQPVHNRNVETVHAVAHMNKKVNAYKPISGYAGETDSFDDMYDNLFGNKKKKEAKREVRKERVKNRQEKKAIKKELKAQKKAGLISKADYKAGKKDVRHTFIATKKDIKAIGKSVRKGGSVAAAKDALAKTAGISTRMSALQQERNAAEAEATQNIQQPEDAGAEQPSSGVEAGQPVAADYGTLKSGRALPENGGGFTQDSTADIPPQQNFELPDQETQLTDSTGETVSEAAQQQNDEAAPVEEKPKSKTAMYVGIGVAIAVIVILIIMFK